MKNLANWAQVFGTLGLLMGIGLVIYELQQTRQLAIIQVRAASFTDSEAIDALLVGENLAETMVRIEDPNAEITKEDLLRYDGFAYARIRDLKRDVWLAKQGFYSKDWTEYIHKAAACYYFGHDVGRAYLRSPALPHDDVAERLSELAADCSDQGDYLQFMSGELDENRLAR